MSRQRPFYVTHSSKSVPILGKYTAFDLGILKISVKELTEAMDMASSAPFCSSIDSESTVHMSYSEMAKKLTPLSQATQVVNEIYEKGSQSATQEIIDRHSTVFKGIGKHRYRQVELSIDKTVKPKIQPQRRVPFPKREQFDKILQELEESDIIEPVEGPTEWISNVVLTPKADPSQLRMNIDMTTANSAIKRIRHVIPTLEELRYKLNGTTHFTKLDMKHGYVQLELDPKSRYMTTFYTHRGLRRFKRLNFGTNSAAELFHQEICQTLVDITNADNIYDDIIIYGRSKREHDIALEQTLQRFQDCGLTLNLSKCKFDQPEIEFFGMKFSTERMSPTLEKVEALLQVPPPTSVAEVRSFLGMANYSASFIKGYSSITAPLRALTKKHVRFVWTEDCQKAFEHLKKELVSPTVMAYYDPNRDTKLIVDGSKYGLSSMLTQFDPTAKQYRVIRYDSRSTTSPETRYAQIEIESAAVHFAVRRNHIYLYGLPHYTVNTDHKPLVPIYNSYRADIPLRIQKHKLNLQGYNFTLIYEPGKDNPTDYTSRHPLPATNTRPQELKDVNKLDFYVNAVVRDDLPTAVTLERLREATRQDDTLQLLIKDILQGYVSTKNKLKLSPYLHVFQELSVVDGLVLRGTKLLVPASLWKTVVKLSHEGHQGIVRTKQLLRSTMWFPGMDRLAEKEVAQCMPCQVTVSTHRQEPLKPTQLPQEPWDKLATDLYGPLASGEYLLVVQCHYSRFPVVEIVSSTSVHAVIPAMDRIMSNFGIPQELTSDNGPPYNSETFGHFAHWMGFKHTKKTPYTPWANGMAENFMKNLGKVIQTAEEEKLNWRQELQRFLRAYRATPHLMTHMSPAALLFNGRKYKTRLPTPSSKTVLIFDDEVRKQDMFAKEKMKTLADQKGYVKPIDIKVGDHVLCRQKKVNKRSRPYASEVLTVIQRKGSLVVARGKSRTITRHVTFFKKLSPEFEVTSDPFTNGDTEIPETLSRSVPLTPPPTPQQPLEDILPLVQPEDGRERLAFRASSPETPADTPQSGTRVEPASQDSKAVGKEGTEQIYVATERQSGGKGVGPHLQARQQRSQRIRRPPARYRDENFEYVQK